MNKRTGRIAVMAALLGFATVALADDLDTIEQAIRAAWNKHKTMTATFTMKGTMDTGGQTATNSGEGKLEIMRQGDKVLSRMEMKSKMVIGEGDSKMEMEQEATFIVDGEYAYSIAKSMGQTTAMKLDIDPQMTSDPKATFEQLKKNFTLSVKPEETVDGAKAYVIEALAKEGSQGQMPKMVLYYNKDTGFPIKTVMFNTAGKETMVMGYSDVKFDGSIDPKRFVFETPAGVTVMDQTSKANK